MPRKTYKLTDETYEVLKGNEQSIAKEMECDPSYIYGIRNQENPDPYPKFRALFRASANAGAPIYIWLNDLQSIGKRKKQTVTAQDFYTALIRKIEVDAQSTEEILKAVKDGEVDKHECQKIASMVESIEANLVGLKELLHLKLGECNEQNIRVM